MNEADAMRLLGLGLPVGAKSRLAGLAGRLGHWPVLLRLANRSLREHLRQKLPVVQRRSQAPRLGRTRQRDRHVLRKHRQFGIMLALGGFQQRQAGLDRGSHGLVALQHVDPEIDGGHAVAAQVAADGIQRLVVQDPTFCARSTARVNSTPIGAGCPATTWLCPTPGCCR